MNTNNTTIVVDAMGGDNSPFKVLKGIEIFNKSSLIIFTIITFTFIQNHKLYIILKSDDLA